MFGHRFFGARYFGPRYWGDGGDAPAAVVVLDRPSGVRRTARFLRRAPPKLPWEIEEEDQSADVAIKRSRRIRLPIAKRAAAEIAAPIQTIREIAAPIIAAPKRATASKAIEDDDEEWLLLI